MNTAKPQFVPTEQVFGVAKKIALELEKLNISEHSAVITMLHSMCVHRENRMKMEMQQAQIDANEAAMESARKAHAMAQVAKEAAGMATQSATGVHIPPMDAAKKPRLVIEDIGRTVEKTAAGLAGHLERQAQEAEARGDAGAANALLEDARTIAKVAEEAAEEVATAQ